MQEMTEVLAWLPAGFYTYWIGGVDMQGSDMIRWTHTGDIIPGTFWAPGEPDHTRGDCVSMNTIMKRLQVHDCNLTLLPFCKIHN